MSKYRIFTESKDFIFTNNIILCIVFAVVTILYLLQKYVFSWFLISEINFQFILVLPVLLALYFLIFSHWNTYEPLEGTLETYLELHEDYIIIENKKYALDEINSMEILNYDFKGDFNYRGRGNFNGILSNGIENLFKINLVGGKSVEVNFQQDKENELVSAKRQLVTYYKKGKISFKDFAKVLGYKDSDLEIVESIIKYYS